MGDSFPTTPLPQEWSEGLKTAQYEVTSGRLLRLAGVPLALLLASSGTLFVLDRALPGPTGAPSFSTSAICSGDAIPIGAPEACGALTLTSGAAALAASILLYLLAFTVASIYIGRSVAAKRLRFAPACRFTYALAVASFYGVNATVSGIGLWLVCCVEFGPIWYLTQPESVWIAAPLGFLARWLLLPSLVLQFCAALILAAIRIAAGVTGFGVAMEFIPGHSVSRADAPTLWAALTQWCSMLQLSVPQHVLVGLTGFTSYREGPVASLDGVHTGGTLYCSLPVARMVRQSELCADVAQCLGATELRHLDPGFTRELDRQTEELIREGERAPLESATAPGRAVVEMWREIWLPLGARAHEEWATQVIARGSVAGGMQHVAFNFIVRFRCTEYWQPFMREVYRALKNGWVEDGAESVPARKYYANLSRRFVEYLHRQMGPAVSATNIAFASEDPAIALFDNAESWEERLSSRERRELVFE